MKIKIPDSKMVPEKARNRKERRHGVRYTSADRPVLEEARKKAEEKAALEKATKTLRRAGAAVASLTDVAKEAASSVEGFNKAVSDVPLPPVRYLCDPEKHLTCKRVHCQNPCKYTTNIAYAKEPAKAVMAVPMTQEEYDQIVGETDD